ncbi:MAG: DUF3108 domain-containing protein ['Candidatus Kapabacteria' thiocyanatum]|mgnify:CR=1 FL=1|uniref:DUF3108 domain-containing protein n=1 Tax=Candidatus Kapaibacterium thiocyanatum TaxID=1895771 RepID=A0A1M3KUY0_9BACT|nr:DUF3108 domain-containing protein ['Candidatus Kapabacteria' thiocyanatum]OJX56199.1 MAG: hypothetical protein BGO89_12715 ['Candidatus Kapabacteria' thiocyanatum]
MNTMIRLAVVGIIMLTAGLTRASAQSFLYPGEELTFRVSYLNITLGTVKSVVEPYTTLDGRRVAKVKVYINSHPNIPFVSLHSIYESWVDTTVTFSYKFNANTQVDDKWEFDQYLFDYTNKLLTMEKYRDKQKVSSKTAEIKKRFNDGSSLLFAARSMLYSKKSYRMPTVIMEDTVSTVINFQGKQEAVDIDAASYPVRTVYFNGDANWTGIYGLTGRFEGWFSDDEARIPIKAKMKVYVGSVTIELQSWKRGSWQPPKAG